MVSSPWSPSGPPMGLSRGGAGRGGVGGGLVDYGDDEDEPVGREPTSAAKKFKFS